MFVVKVPGINGLGKTDGCKRSGDAILKILGSQIYTNESGKEIDLKNLDLEEIHLDNNNLQETNELIYKNSFEVFETKQKVIFLGGDHSISYPIVRAFFDYCHSLDSAKEPCLIVFDAHADCMAPLKEPTHEEWLRALIKDSFPARNILIIGLRNSTREELDFIKEKGIKTINFDQLLIDFEGSCDAITEFVNNRELYVSIDIDAVDPAFAPSTGYPEPGGLTSREIIYLAKRINKIKTLRAVDIVEINAEKDKKKDYLTLKLGAKILSEFI
ncbi:MAG TPA: arginase family protein [Candidatus Nanoarchaeia archaeon]|nr:arginase family protein [Candidatus Nanoarchaeia archaeon]